MCSAGAYLLHGTHKQGVDSKRMLFWGDTAFHLPVDKGGGRRENPMHLRCLPSCLTSSGTLASDLTYRWTPVSFYVRGDWNNPLECCWRIKWGTLQNIPWHNVWPSVTQDYESLPPFPILGVMVSVFPPLLRLLQLSCPTARELPKCAKCAVSHSSDGLCPGYWQWWPRAF